MFWKFPVTWLHDWSAKFFVYQHIAVGSSKYPQNYFFFPHTSASYVHMFISQLKHYYPFGHDFLDPLFLSLAISYQWPLTCYWNLSFSNYTTLVSALIFSYLNCCLVSSLVSPNVDAPLSYPIFYAVSGVTFLRCRPHSFTLLFQNSRLSCWRSSNLKSKCW